MMGHLTRRYDTLLLAKSNLVNNSALFDTLKSKNLGNAAIEECLKGLQLPHELYNGQLANIFKFHELPSKLMLFSAL